VAPSGRPAYFKAIAASFLHKLSTLNGDVETDDGPEALIHFALASAVAPLP